MGKYSTAVFGGVQEEKAPRKYASKILGGEQVTTPKEQGFSGRLPLEDLEYRGKFAPVGVTKEGKGTWAIPEFAVGIAESAMAPGRWAQGEPVTARSLAEFGLNIQAPLIRGLGGTGMKVKAGKIKTPSAKDLKGQASKIYGEIESSPIKVRPEGFQTMFDDLILRLRDRGFHPKMHPKAAGAVEAIGDFAGKAVTMKDMGIIRRLAKSAKKSIDPDEARIGREILTHIDENMRQLPGVSAKFTQADKLWSMGKKSELLDKAVSAAKETASGFENGLRIEFRKLLKKNREGKLQLSAQEAAAMQKVVEGSIPANILKGLGKLGPAPGGAGNALLAVIAGSGGYALGGPLGMATVMGGGYGSRLGAQALTKGAAERAQGVVAGAAPQMRQVPVGTQGVPRTALSQVPGIIGRTQALPTPAPLQALPTSRRSGRADSARNAAYLERYDGRRARTMVT